MKWYFAINQSGLSAYEYMIKGAVLSAKKHTSLTPHCIYTGGQNSFTNWLEKEGVKIIYWSSKLTEEINNTIETEYWNRKTAEGAYLRLDIPLIETTDEFILYTDCDVLFTKNFELPTVRPKFFAAAPENNPNNWTYANTGSMVINTHGLRSQLPKIYEEIKGKLNSLVKRNQGTYDQAVLNLAFPNLWERLPIEYNWKPYWGLNPASKIIHFHGPKPEHIRATIISFENANIPIEYKRLFNLSPLSMAYHLGLFDSFGINDIENKIGYIDLIKLNTNNTITIEGWFSSAQLPRANELRCFINGEEITPQSLSKINRIDVSKFLKTEKVDFGFLLTLPINPNQKITSLKIFDSDLKYELITTPSQRAQISEIK